MLVGYLKESGRSHQSWRMYQIFHYLPIARARVEGVHHPSVTDLGELEVEVGEALRERAQRLPRTLLQKQKILWGRRMHCVLR
jgi:hypothetical protein